jgi:nucleoside phosphorylase
MPSPVNAIFVPQGAEFQAVQRGLKRSGSSNAVLLYAVPMGPEPVQRFVRQWLQDEFKHLGNAPAVLLTGLCGSLKTRLPVGDRLLYQSCIDGRLPPSVPPLKCDALLLKTLQERLSPSVTEVTGLMCDRMVHLATEKSTLAQRYGADVVDMEGYAFLQALQSTGIAVGMLRVVSDDAQHDVPDLAAAMTETGELKPLALASTLIRQPRRALRLIQGSLVGLKQLEGAIAQLCQEN